jgi:hypothetical protein
MFGRWVIPLAGVAAVVVAMQTIPYGHDYADDRVRAAPIRDQGDRTGADEEGATPASLIIEHVELHATLQAIVALPGATGMAAQHVANLLDEHFKREEEFGMPPLALLRPLAEGQEVRESAPAGIAMSQRLKSDWPRMLAEHREIGEALSVLAVEARAENRPDVLPFVEELRRHALHEEEVLYPAAILVGEYLTLRDSR